MNKNGTELSLFQGGPSVQISSDQAAEEEEDREDRIRREAELEKELQGAFDDLHSDDEHNDTINSTNNSTTSHFAQSNGHQGNFYPKQTHLLNGFSHGKQEENNRHFNRDFSERDEITRFKNLLESKSRELESISNKLLNERKINTQQVEELKKRLMIAEAEKERANAERNQEHELLIASKTKIIQMEESNEKLRSRIKSLESENSQLVSEIESNKISLSDYIQRYELVQRGAIYKKDQNAENLLKHQEDRHQAKITMMQQNIDSLQSKLENLEHDHKNLDIRYKELQKSREHLLIDKGEIINQLNKNLEDAQRQVQDLMTRPNYHNENVRLKDTIKSLEAQTEEMAKTIKVLSQKLNKQTMELQVVDTLIQESDGNNLSYSESNFLHHRTPSNLLKNIGGAGSTSTPMAPADRFENLKMELHKSMDNVKIKREEIKLLEKQLMEKNQEIQDVRNDENKALVELNHYKDETTKLQGKVNSLEIELDKMKYQVKRQSSFGDKENRELYEKKVLELEEKNNEMSATLEQLQSEFEQLNMKYNVILEEESQKDRQICDLHTEIQHLRQKNVNVSFDNEKLVKKFQELKQTDFSESAEKIACLERALETNQKKFEELTKQLEYEKSEKQKQLENLKDKINCSIDMSEKAIKNSSNNCLKCTEYVKEIAKFEITCLQLQNTNSDYLKELAELKSELDDLNEKLNLKECRDQEIDKLKKKALEFEEYMRSHPRSGSYNSSNKSSSPQSVNNTNSTMKTDLSSSPFRKLVKNQSSCTSPEPNSTDKSQFESRVRDEMAKLYAGEIKTIEMKYREDQKKFEHDISELQSELSEVSRCLHVRTQEVEVLKFTILKEREKFEETLQKKNGEFKVFVDKQNETILKYRAEYEKALNKIEILQEELNEKSHKMIEEREKMNMILKEISEERLEFARKEDETVQRIKQLQEESNDIIDKLNEKYLTAKKTALQYKQYSEDKEKHMLKEYDRIKNGYDEARQKAQALFKETLQKQDKLIDEKIRKITNEFEFKIDFLKTELEEKKRLLSHSQDKR